MKALKVNKEYKITFGKYKEKTLDEIADVDPDYLLWLHENVKHIKIEKKFITAVEMDVRERDSELHDILAEHQFDIF